ncbi:hypothetical protein J2853_002711 [Streptosporangium lutulentum]|uniref:Uncharacterized protein n=1 Tax=Streptosporangium lutulentum TaxID=1461250 RepID=A0ABT9QAV0_9ACTN|nr:hypothetical protein [Streptosporangium lutulentum]
MPNRVVFASLASRSASEKHRTAGIEAPTPRGSHPTRSNRSSRGEPARLGLRAAAISVPEAPGPPGLITRDPTRCSREH